MWSVDDDDDDGGEGKKNRIKIHREIFHFESSSIDIIIIIMNRNEKKIVPNGKNRIIVRKASAVRKKFSEQKKLRNEETNQEKETEMSSGLDHFQHTHTLGFFYFLNFHSFHSLIHFI